MAVFCLNRPPGRNCQILGLTLGLTHLPFQEEYLEFLQRGGVEYDERYLW